MIITGIAHAPEKLNERSSRPSAELIYLASRALRMYKASHVISSLAPGWEQALVKAAIELRIPFTVAIPFPGRELMWDQEARRLYLELMAQAEEVYRLNECPSDEAAMEGHLWRADRADIVLTLWDYQFYGETFRMIEHALKDDKEVVNLWEEWCQLCALRKARPSVTVTPSQVQGAQIFNSRR
jgi:hypothetical protein